MNNKRLLAQSMARECLTTLRTSDENEWTLPRPLHLKHLLWMCEAINEHSNHWPIAKLHRWIGFVQAGLLANRMLTLKQLKLMFDKSKAKYGIPDEDDDLIDHLDPTNAFELDIGGQA